MDPTCRSCGGYPCDCGQAIGVPIKTSNGLMIREGFGSDLSLKPYIPEPKKTKEEIQAERMLQLEKQKEEYNQMKNDLIENNICKDKETARRFLEEAIKTNDINLAKKSLSFHPTLDKIWSRDDTLLHTAIKKGYYEMSVLLLDNKANVNAQGSSSSTYASQFTPIIDAVRMNHIEFVKLLLDYKANPLFTDNVGRTALEQTENEKILSLLKDHISSNK